MGRLARPPRLVSGRPASPRLAPGPPASPRARAARLAWCPARPPRLASPRARPACLASCPARLVPSSLRAAPARLGPQRGNRRDRALLVGTGRTGLFSREVPVLPDGGGGGGAAEAGQGGGAEAVPGRGGGAGWRRRDGGGWGGRGGAAEAADRPLPCSAVHSPAGAQNSRNGGIAANQQDRCRFRRDLLLPTRHGGPRVRAGRRPCSVRERPRRSGRVEPTAAPGTPCESCEPWTADGGGMTADGTTKGATPDHWSDMTPLCSSTPKRGADAPSGAGTT
jgi:hypothetical protein